MIIISNQGRTDSKKNWEMREKIQSVIEWRNYNISQSPWSPHEAPKKRYTYSTMLLAETSNNLKCLLMKKEVQ